MGLFSKKSLTEIINKNFNERQIEYDVKNSIISFSINLDNDITLYPNIKVDNRAEELTFIINIKRGDSKAIKDFNNKSKYLKALVNDNIVYLYYSCFATSENVIFIIDTIISSLQVLENDIINL